MAAEALKLQEERLNALEWRIKELETGRIAGLDARLRLLEGRPPNNTRQEQK